MEQQTTKLENIFTLRMETVLTWRIIPKANTQIAHIDRVKDRLQ